MNANQKINPRGYKMAFVINGLVGIFLMILSIVGFAVESIYKISGLGWDLMFPALGCFLISAVMYAMYLNAQNQISKN
jgi:ABC-type uncharacterized transport system permease subunit